MALRPAKSSRLLFLLAFLLFASLRVLSQTLAHRNWEGSGLTAQSWWTRATFCDIDLHADPNKTLHSLTARLDDLQSIGCEALVLDILSPDNTSPAALTSGTLDDADELIDQMSHRKLRLVLPLPIAAQNAATLDRMRFWLSRGVAGFLLRCTDGSAPSNDAALLHQAHQVAAAALGTRVLIAEGIAPLPTSATVHRAADAQLDLRRVGLSADAATLRARLSRKASPLPLLGLEPQDASPAAAETRLNVDRLRLEATILLGNGSAALLPPEALAVLAAHHTSPSSSGVPSDDMRLWVPENGDPQSPTPHDELVTWYRALAELRHTSSALRAGETTYLAHDTEGLLAWVVRPRGTGPALLFVCNLSGHTAHVSLAGELRALSVHGTSLRPVLTTEANSPHATLGAIDLPKDGILAGEIR